MRNCIVSILVLGVFASSPLAVRVQGDPEPPPALTDKVSLDLREASLHQAVALTLQGSGLSYAIGPGVPDVPFTLKVERVSRAVALRLVVRQVRSVVEDLTLTRDPAGWMVYRRHQPGRFSGVPFSAPAAFPGSDRKTSLELEATPLRDALALVFRGTGVRYSVAPDVPNVPVTLSAKDASLGSVVRLLLRAAWSAEPALAATYVDDAYRITLRQGSGIRGQ